MILFIFSGMEHVLRGLYFCFLSFYFVLLCLEPIAIFFLHALNFGKITNKCIY